MGRKKKITPEIADEMRGLRLQGWTKRELAEKYNCCTGAIDNAIKEYGLRYVPKVDERICVVCGKQYIAKSTKQVCCSVSCQRKRETVTTDETAIVKQIEDKLPGFEYAGNYTGSNGTVDLKCKKCGAIINRACVTVRHGRIRCEICEEVRTAIKTLEDKLAKRKRECEKENAKRIRETERRFGRIKDGIKRIATRKHLCAWCGSVTHSRNAYCSGECSARAERSRHDARRRRKVRDVLVDKDIDLSKVYRNDNGICYLCGTACDWNDGKWENGTFYVGSDYPSIDHVLPLAKGGKHEWNNVRLAHFRCNSLKSDKIITPLGL